jgi:hypothetical protein
VALVYEWQIERRKYRVALKLMNDPISRLDGYGHLQEILMEKFATVRTIVDRLGLSSFTVCQSRAEDFEDSLVHVLSLQQTW